MRGTNWGFSSQRVTTYQARAILESKGNTRHTVELGNMSYGSLVLQNTKLRSSSPSSISISKLNSMCRLKSDSRIIFRETAAQVRLYYLNQYHQVIRKNCITSKFYCKGAVKWKPLKLKRLSENINFHIPNFHLCLQWL